MLQRKEQLASLPLIGVEQPTDASANGKGFLRYIGQSWFWVGNGGGLPEGKTPAVYAGVTSIWHSWDPSDSFSSTMVVSADVLDTTSSMSM